MRTAAARIEAVLADAVAEGAWPGGVLLAGCRAAIAVRLASGCHTDAGQRPVRADDVFDIASLTKVVCTTTAIMQLCDRGRIELDAAVIDFLPEFAGPPGVQAGLKRRVTVRQLLAHASGLAGYRPLYREADCAAAFWDALWRLPLAAPPGARCVYSDLGFLVLGRLVEALSGQALDAYFRTAVAEPLGLRATCFKPGAALAGRVLPTEFDAVTGVCLCGRVHDENARALGGVAGHAGLFAAADDLAVFARMLLNRGWHDGNRFLNPATVSQFTRRAELVPGSSRCLGWDGPSRDCSGGDHLSDASFGHTGFTGTSLWLDPAHDVFVLLLTNAVHPDRARRAQGYFTWRRRVHNVAHESLGRV